MRWLLSLPLVACGPNVGVPEASESGGATTTSGTGSGEVSTTTGGAATVTTEARPHRIASGRPAPGSSAACWVPIHAEPAPLVLAAESLFVDGDTIWIAGCSRIGAVAADAGALFSVDCG